MAFTLLTLNAKSKTLSPYCLRDALESLSPDLLVFTGSTKELQQPPDQWLRSLFPDTEIPSVVAPHQIPETQIISAEDIQIVVPTEFSELCDIAKAESTGALDPNKRTFILSNLLDIVVERHSLSATLSGKTQYQSQFPADQLEGRYTHLLTTQDAGHESKWNELSVYGVSPPTGENEPPAVSTVALPSVPSEKPVARQYPQYSLGLQMLNAVGPSRAETLADAGFSTRQAVVDAPEEALTQLSGLGAKTVTQILASAHSTVKNVPVKTSTRPVPASTADPLYISLQTTGPASALVWLLAIYDSADDEYTTFLAKDPQNPETAVGEFLTWLVEANSDQPLVTWDRESTYTPITRSSNFHFPNYSDFWDQLPTLSLKSWAVEQENVVLPSRTPSLEDVAQGLDVAHNPTVYESAQAIHSYRQWMENQSSETEPGWDKYAALTIKQCLAVSAIHSRLSSPPLTTTGDEALIQSTTSTQSPLNSW